MQWLFNFLTQNSLAVGAVVSLVCLFIPSPAKWAPKAGLYVSGFLAHALGKKAEAEFKDILDEFSKGLHADDTGGSK
jgi:hypothetical protein